MVHLLRFLVCFLPYLVVIGICWWVGPIEATATRVVFLIVTMLAAMVWADRLERRTRAWVSPREEDRP